MAIFSSVWLVLLLLRKGHVSSSIHHNTTPVRMSTFRTLLLAIIISQLLSCIVVDGGSSSTETVRAWYSSELLPESPEWFLNPPDPSAITYKLSRQPDIKFSRVPKDSELLLEIDTTEQYQTLLGIGMALEGTTLYAMRKNKSDEQLREVIKAFIDAESGIGFNMFRLAIGLSDFSDGRAISDHPQGFYTYQDDSTQDFSIQKDIDYGKIEMIKKVQKISKELDPSREPIFFGSTWSPPAWMKTNGKLIKGTLKPGYEEKLARYFRQFVEAYEDQGIPIYAITMQNEPNFEPDAYPGMRLSPQQEGDLVKATYREFRDPTDGTRVLDTRLWISDHNLEDWVNAHQVLTDLSAENIEYYVDGVAFHNYIAGDSISYMSRLQALHPGIHLQLTEHSEWGVAGMYNIQQYFVHGSESYMYWVAMTTKDLDEHNQSPYADAVELSPTLLIEKESGSAEYYRTPEYYLIGQFSKFIRPGAVRVGCSVGSTDRVTAVAFKNEDGKVACVLVNQTEEDQPFQIGQGERSFSSVVPAKAVATYVWQ